MKIIVCGAGQVGYQIARHLSDEGNALTVIDNDAGLVRRVTDELDVNGVVGFASQPDILARAGARDADMLIAATSTDEVNMVACQVAHSVFDVTTKIARVRTESYLEAEWSDLFRRDHMPIDVVISPEAEVAKVTMRRLASTACFDIEPFLDGEAIFYGVRVNEDCPILNTQLRQLTELFSTLKTLIVAIRREGRIFTTDGDDQIFPGDEVYCVSAASDKDRTIGILGRENHKIERIIIIGAGNVGLKVAQRIEKTPGMRAKMIELNRERAEHVADTLEQTIVLNGNALHADLMAEAGFGEADALVALTEDDRTNLIASALAQQAGCPVSIALSKEPVFERIAAPLGVDALINPRATTVSSILRHIRRGRIKAVYSLGRGEAEVIEAQVMQTSPIAGKRIRDVKFPVGAVIGAIQHKSNIVMPRGDTVISEGDRLVVFAEKASVQDVERLFRVSMEYF